MDVVVWLRSLGLGQYEKVFRENEIDEAVLPNLTAEDLKELGVAALGHRRKLLDAIAALRGDANATPAAAPGPATVDAPPRDTAERRQVTVMFSDLMVRRPYQHAWTPRTCVKSFRPIRNESLRRCSSSMASLPNIWATAF